MGQAGRAAPGHGRNANRAPRQPAPPENHLPNQYAVGLYGRALCRDDGCRRYSPILGIRGSQRRTYPRDPPPAARQRLCRRRPGVGQPVSALGLPLPLPGSTLIAQPWGRPGTTQPAAGNPNRGHRCQPIYRRRTPCPAHRHPHQRQIRRPQCRLQCQPRQSHALPHGFGGGG